MSWNLQQTINWARGYNQYTPLTAGLGQEPAVTIASMIRASMLNPPLTWFWNRNTATFPTVIGQQDYSQAIPDLAFVEKVSLQDDTGNIYEIKDVYNNTALSPSSFQQRPSAMSVESSSVVAGALTFLFRFTGVPEAVYTVIVTYQKIPPMFGPFFINSVAAHIGPNTIYTGTFDTISFPVGSIAIVTGFVATAGANNGSYAVVGCTATTLTLANPAGVIETLTGYVSNFNWDPIPDYFSDVFNNLFLSEVMRIVDDAASQTYRLRGVGALLSKASGLTEMQKNTFAQTWLARGTERQSAAGAIHLGQQGRSL